MLLTLKPTAQIGYPSPHAYPSPKRHLSESFPSAVKVGSLPLLGDGALPTMSTPHRGLPPPSAMTLPTPDRGPPSSNLALGQLPAAPTSWHGADESMRNWLHAKAEEDRRKQEEERTRQEGLRLEQRKIEQTMLRESLQGGVPPHMVPIVFASMGGGHLANASLEWAQHYMAQISLQQQAQIQQQQQQQVQLQTAPEARRENRMIGGPAANPYGGQQVQQQQQQQPQQPPQTSPAQSVPAQQQQGAGFVPSYQSPSMSNDRARMPQPLQSAPPTSAPRPPQQALSRLNTGEMQIQPPPQGPQGVQLSAQHPLQQAQTASQQEQGQSSPSIYFHHWVPPNAQGNNKEPQTPSGKSQQESPYSQNAGAHLRSDYTNSPKKRKTNASQQASSAPTTTAPETSPSFSHTSSSSTGGARRRDHSRDGSSPAVNDAIARPRSRQRYHKVSPRQAIQNDSGRRQQASIQADARQRPPQQYRTGSETRQGEERNYSPKREAERPS